MLTTSAEFNAAVLASVRKPRAKVQITWTDSEQDNSITVTASETNRGAFRPQVADGIDTIPYKWFQLGSNDLTGSYRVGPSTLTGSQVGWWGTTRSHAVTGAFASTIDLTVEFDARPIYGIRVVGDTANEEYPVDFNVGIYSGAVQLALIPFTGNTEVIREITETELLGSYTDVTKIELYISKWSAPGETVKIAEFYSSIVSEYTGDDVHSLKLLDEAEIKDGTIPIGNISANEIDIALGNVVLGDGTVDPFFPDNANSPYWNLLKPGRKIRPYIGLQLPDESIEWVPLGLFWSKDWQSDDMGTVVTTSARDRMEFLRNATYVQGQIYQDTTLYAYLEAVLTSAQTDIPMADLSWDIDTELQSYSVAWAWLPTMSYFNAIKQICAAGVCQAWMSREDVLIVGRVA